MKIINLININEINGEDIKLSAREELQIESHWNYKDRVVLIFGDKKITVLADELIYAIKNSCNKPF